MQEEVEQQKARFRALNALPPKKVMQAIQRKRLKAKRILSRLVEKDKNNPTCANPPFGPDLSHKP